MITVKATREGLIGGKTSTGYIVEIHCPFVALPSVAALRQWVRVYNPLTDRATRALVLDVGPWNEQDHLYVFQPATMSRAGLPVLFNVQGREREQAIAELMARYIRPAAEGGPDTRGRKTNGAGIDLGECVWKALGMVDNGPVCWEFD